MAIENDTGETEFLLILSMNIPNVCSRINNM